jgi:hypothetical protein
LGIEGVVVDVLIVDAIFLTASDANFLRNTSVLSSRGGKDTNPHHLEPLLHGGSTLQVLGRGLDIPVDRLLRQINHVRAEERLSVFLEVFLVRVQHTIQPWQELLGAVIGVQNDGDTVDGGDGSDVVGASNRSSNRGFLLAVCNTLFEFYLAAGHTANLKRFFFFTFPAKYAAPP